MQNLSEAASNMPICQTYVSRQIDRYFPQDRFFNVAFESFDLISGRVPQRRVHSQGASTLSVDGITADIYIDVYI